MEDKNKDKENKNSNKVINISAGIVSSYATEYLENVFRNILHQEENIFKDTNSPEDYLVAIVAGAACSLFDNLPTFPSVVMSTALYYGLYAGIDSLKGKDIEEEKLVKDFLIDVFFIYLIFLFYEAFQTKNNDASTFTEALADNLPLDTLISVYYALRDYFTEEKNGNDKKRLSKRKEDSIIYHRTRM
ncbi:MAG: hypothetical protein GX661_00880 [Acholeplasmataceae bacterium]|nr:hypothetical protein [Acholeplasmataceae bacterium]